jgi:hypothetical protein
VVPQDSFAGLRGGTVSHCERAVTSDARGDHGKLQCARRLGKAPRSTDRSDTQKKSGKGGKYTARNGRW